jgi:hypothetical protein
VSQTKPAQVRYYFDADLLGPAKVLAKLRPDVTYPGDPGDEVFKRRREPCPVADVATPDRVWIPIVTGAGWIILTRDHQIQSHRSEIDAVREHAARMVAISSTDPLGTFGQLEVIIVHWRKIEALIAREGPFIYAATRASFKAIKLDAPG